MVEPTGTADPQATQTVLWSVGIRAASGDRAGYPPVVKNAVRSRTALLFRCFIMLRILDTAVTLTFFTIVAVAAVLVLGAFSWIIDTSNRFHAWLRGKRYRSMFVAPPKRRKRRWWWQAAYHRAKRSAKRGSPRTDQALHSTSLDQLRPRCVRERTSEYAEHTRPMGSAVRRRK